MRSTLCFFINTNLPFFAELNAEKDKAISSAYGWERPGLRRRGAGREPVQPLNLRAEPLEISEFNTNYMTHDVRLRVAGGKVVQASFQGNIIPGSREVSERNHFLVRPAKIKRFDVVIYVRQNGTLMGVRPPNPSGKVLSINYVTDTLSFLTPSLLHAKNYKIIEEIKQSKYTLLEN